MSYITLVSDLIIVFFISLFLLYYNFFSSLFVILFIVILSGFLLRLTNNKFKQGYLAAENDLGPAPVIQGGAVPSAKEVHARLEDIRTRVRYHG